MPARSRLDAARRTGIVAFPPPSTASLDAVHTDVFTFAPALSILPHRTEPEDSGVFVMKQPPNVASTRLFRNGNSQAVRIPKALAFDSVGMEVEIERRDDELIVRPVKKRLMGLGAAFRGLAPHLRGFTREQPIQDRREWTPARSDARERRGPGNS